MSDESNIKIVLDDIENELSFIRKALPDARALLAGMAMQGMLADGDWPRLHVAENAVKFADELMVELVKKIAKPPYTMVCQVCGGSGMKDETLRR